MKSDELVAIELNNIAGSNCTGVTVKPSSLSTVATTADVAMPSSHALCDKVRLGF